MAAARPDIDYEILALDVLMATEPERIRDLMAVVSNGLASGEITPLPVEIYPLAEAKTAFRRMQQARHVGKIVLQMPNPLKPREDRTYLITGGLGALGLHTAAYLAQLGAGDIVLTSRRPPDAVAQGAIDEMTERYRCRIHTFAADVGDEGQVRELLARMRAELPPLGGVAHLAGVIDDALLPQQTAGPVPHDIGPEVVRRLAPPSADARTTSSSSSSCTHRAPVCSAPQARPTTRPPTRCSTGSLPTARLRACLRRASTGARGRTAAWPTRTPCGRISAHAA